MAPQKVLYFVDTGGDDAFFLVYVLNHPEIFVDDVCMSCWELFLKLEIQI